MSPPPGGTSPWETGGLAVGEDFDQLAGSNALLYGAPGIDPEQVGVMLEKDLAQIGCQPEEALVLLGEDIVVPHREPRLRAELLELVTRLRATPGN